MSKSPDTLDLIIAFEQGETTNVQTLELFSQLIKSGDHERLQGSYFRQARVLIDTGYLTQYGEITDWGRTTAEEADFQTEA